MKNQKSLHQCCHLGVITEIIPALQTVVFIIESLFQLCAWSIVIPADLCATFIKTSMELEWNFPPTGMVQVYADMWGLLNFQLNARKIRSFPPHCLFLP